MALVLLYKACTFIFRRLHSKQPPRDLLCVRLVGAGIVGYTGTQGGTITDCHTHLNPGTNLVMYSENTRLA